MQKIVRRVDRVATAKTRALEPILEQQNEYQLVHVNHEVIRKKRNESLKQKARIMSGTRLPKMRFENDATFLTGGVQQQEEHF